MAGLRGGLPRCGGSGVAYDAQVSAKRQLSALSWRPGRAGGGGRAWNLVTPIRLPPGTQAVPDLVEAIAPGDVWAATTIDPPGDNGPLRIGITHWNGHTWQPVTYPYGPLIVAD